MYFAFEPNAPQIENDGTATFALLQKDGVHSEVNRFEVYVPAYEPKNCIFIKTAIMLHVFAAYAIMNDSSVDMDVIIRRPVFTAQLDATLAELVSAAEVYND